MNHLLKSFHEYPRSLFDLFFPDLCLGCKAVLLSVEQSICLSCQLSLPKTGFHSWKGNPAESNFHGRIDLFGVGSFLHFEKGGLVQELMHAIKYKGRQDLAEELGFLYGKDLLSTPFAGANRILPIPLHPRKRKSRGFNQAEAFGNGLGKALKVPVDASSLVRTRFTNTQTGMDRFRRWQNVSNAFKLVRSIHPNERIILIDDVLTSGATLEAAALALVPHGMRNIGVLTLAYAQ